MQRDKIATILKGHGIKIWEKKKKKLLKNCKILDMINYLGRTVF